MSTAVEQSNTNSEPPADDYNKYIDYSIKLILKDNTKVEGTIIRYGTESITLKVKEKKTKNKTFERASIKDLKVVNIPKVVNKKAKKPTSSKQKTNPSNNNKNDSTFGTLDLDTIKKTDFNFEGSNEKYDYNRTELKTQNDDKLKTNDEEKNDLDLNPKTVKNNKSQSKADKNNKPDSNQLLSLLQKSSTKVASETTQDTKKEKPKKKKTKQTKNTEAAKETSEEPIDINSLPITKAINLSHLCGRINSESTKQKKLKKKMKKKMKTKKIDEEVNEEDVTEPEKKERLTEIKRKEVEAKKKSSSKVDAVSSDDSLHSILSLSDSNESRSDSSSLSSDESDSSNCISLTSNEEPESSSDDSSIMNHKLKMRLNSDSESSSDAEITQNLKDLDMSASSSMVDLQENKGEPTKKNFKKNKNKKKQANNKKNNEEQRKPSLVEEEDVIRLLLEKAMSAGLISGDVLKKQDFLTDKKPEVMSNKKKPQNKKTKKKPAQVDDNEVNDTLEKVISETLTTGTAPKPKSKRKPKKQYKKKAAEEPKAEE